MNAHQAYQFLVPLGFKLTRIEQPTLIRERSTYSRGPLSVQIYGDAASWGAKDNATFQMHAVDPFNHHLVTTIAFGDKLDQLKSAVLNVEERTRALNDARDLLVGVLYKDRDTIDECEARLLDVLSDELDAICRAVGHQLTSSNVDAENGTEDIYCERCGYAEEVWW